MTKITDFLQFDDIIRRIFVAADEAIRVRLVGGDVVIDNAVVNVDSIKPADLNLDVSKNLGVNVITLPAGQATAANQATANASLSSIDGKLPALSGGAVPVSLPAGLATSANQATANTSLASIDAKLPALSGGTVPVSLAAGFATSANQATANTSLASILATAGATGDAAVTDYTAAASLVAALKGLLKLNNPSTAGGQGNKAVTTAATPVQLATTTACTNVIITARVGNTKEIAYGFSNAVRATAGSEIGAQLQPGDSISLRVNNLIAIWIDAQVNGEGVSYTYTTD